MFSDYFALSWRNYAFGIALGFGILASVGLAESAIRSLIAHPSYLLDYLGMATYHCCVLVWIFYMLAPERKTNPPTMKFPDDDLEIWNEELQQLLHQ
jgi:hypothetical protein